MSRKLIETEGPAWVQAGIITAEQQQRLLALYPEQERALGLLPLLGGLLLGLGVLSFVAANWQSLPELARLALLVAVLVAAYGAAELSLRRGQQALGMGLLGVGLLSFGAGIVLVGQMYHLVSYDARALLLWGGAGLALTWLYRSRFLFLLTLLILTGAQWYSSEQFHTFSWVGLTLLGLGLGSYWFRQPGRLLGWALALAWLVQGGLLLEQQHWSGFWLLPWLLLLYAAADWLPRRVDTYAAQLLPLGAAFALALLVGGLREGNWLHRELLQASGWYPVALLGLLALSAGGKHRRGTLASLSEWLVLLPVLYLPEGGVRALVQLLVLYAFSGAVLWQGYHRQWRAQVNAGTLLFLITTASAYFRLTWELLDKSLFFIIGGGLLLTLNWLLQRRNKQALAASTSPEPPRA